MSFDIEKYGGWSNQNDATCYEHAAMAAKSISGNILKLDASAGVGDTVHFEGGTYQIMLHHSLCKAADLDCDNSTDNAVIEKLGKFEIRTVTHAAKATTEIWLTLDAEPDLDLENFYVQAVYIPQLSNFYAGYAKSPTNWGDTATTPAPDNEKYITTIPDAHEPTTPAKAFSIANYYPEAYSAEKKCGGILAVKANRMWLYGGWINLKDKGIPSSLAAYRPLTKQEKYGTLDAAARAGEENSMTDGRLLLNVGDGAAFIISNFYQDKLPTWSNSNTRKLEYKLYGMIGNPSFLGVADCRGASDSPNKPSPQTYPEIAESSSHVAQYGASYYDPMTLTDSEPSNIGAPTIFFAVVYSVQYFTPQIFGGYRAKSDGGKGIGRRYLVIGNNAYYFAVRNKGFLAVDIFKGNGGFRPKTGFGNGSDGTCTNPATCINSYAKVAAARSKIVMEWEDVLKIECLETTLTLSEKTNGLATFKVGGLVLLYGTSSYNPGMPSGGLTLAKISSVTSDTITLNDNVQFGYLDDSDIIDYYYGEDDGCFVRHVGDDVYYEYPLASDEFWQVIAVPQFENFTLSEDYNLTPKWGNGLGGICALAVSKTCDLRGGKLNAEGKGTGIDNSGFRENDWNGNMAIYLPIGSGHGTILLIANELKLNSNSRIGATYDGGANFTGVSPRGETNDYNLDGAHILIFAQTIDGMNSHAISTGGANSSGSGGAGAGCKAENGGAPGSCFIYCNNAVNQSV